MNAGLRAPEVDVAEAPGAVAAVEAEAGELVAGAEQLTEAAASPQSTYEYSVPVVHNVPSVQPQQHCINATADCHVPIQQQQEYRQPADCRQPQPDENVNSAPGGSQNLLNIGLGKYKLKLAHYTFDPAELGRIADETRVFTRDGFAQGLVYKNPACSTDACWLPEKPFQCTDHRGHHCWLDPPVNMIESTLQSYAAAKQYDPSNTSMCILVPVMRKMKWWKTVKGMKRIRLYPKGAELLLSGLDSQSRIQLPYRAAVFYDPPSAPAAMGAAGQTADPQHHMVFSTEIAGKQARVLLDTGASQSFISKDFCAAADMKSVAAPTPQQVKTAGGAEILAHTMCQVSFQLQGMGITVSPLIVPLPEEFTVILGDDWLKSKEAVLNYATQTCTLKKNERGKKHILQIGDGKPSKTVRWRADLLLVRTVEDIGDPTELELSDFSKIEEPYRTLLEKYKDVWPKDLPAGMPPHRPGVELVIPFDAEAQPVASYRMRYSPAEIEEARTQVKRFLEKGFVRPSTSPYGASVLFAPKKDGGLRMCIDYRRVNAQTRKDKHPLPRPEELVDQLRGADTFSGLDLLSGYHQVRVHPTDIQKTAFRTSEGLYEWLVMPFGLSNAPSIFQRVMNDVFRDYLGQSVNVYLDDIMVYSKEPNEEVQAQKHVEALEPILIKMREHRLYGKLSKSFFGLHEIPWLGQILNRDGIRPDPAKTEVVADWPRPRNVKEIQSFLGFANWFRQYMQGYSQHTASLTKLTRKNQEYEWTDECEAAFLWVKKALANAPVLTHADFTKQFTVWTDASIDGVGAVLQQDGKPIAYESARFSPAERNYTIGEQELLAVIHALKKWRVYLEGGPHPVKLRTDHQPLTYLPTKGVLGSRQVRWSEYLSRFDIEWEYIQGPKNIADALSRMPCLHLYVTTRSQAQRVSDAAVGPSGKAAAGSPTNRKCKRMDEREPRDEGPVATSPTRPRAETDVAGAPDEAHASEGTEQQSREPGAMQDNPEVPLEDRQQANEANFLERVREAAYADEDLHVRLWAPAGTHD